MTSEYTRQTIRSMQNTYMTNKRKKAAGESHGAKQAKLRPANYNDLSEGEKWDIDKKLGILDWDGK